MRAVIGHSDEVDTRDAVVDAIEQCRSGLGGETPKAALVFMSVDQDHDLALEAIHAEWSYLPLIGASHDGEASSICGSRRDSIRITLICGDDIEASVGLGCELSMDVNRAVEDALRAAERHGRPAVALTTPAPGTNASEVMPRLNDGLRALSCPALGGHSGDHGESSRVREFCCSEVHADSLPILYLYGDISVSRVRNEHRITMAELRSDGNLADTMSSITDTRNRFEGAESEMAFLLTCAGRKWVLGSRAADWFVLEGDRHRRNPTRQGSG